MSNVQTMERKRLRTSPVEIDGKVYSRTPGGPPFKASKEERQLVEDLVAAGATQAVICQFIKDKKTGKPISHDTLQEYFQEELALGLQKADLKVHRSLFEKCVGRPGYIHTFNMKDENNRLVRNKDGSIRKKVVYVAPIEPETAAIRWWDVSRMKRKVAERLEVTGPDGQPIQHEHTVMVIPANGREAHGAQPGDILRVPSRMLDITPKK